MTTQLFLFLVKRAEETIMFGNQQNEAKEIKKRDNPDDTVDKQGQVIVNDPMEIEDIVESTDNDAGEASEEAEDDSIFETEEETSEGDKELALDEENTALESMEENADQVGYQEYLKELSKLHLMYFNLLNKGHINRSTYFLY